MIFVLENILSTSNILVIRESIYLNRIHKNSSTRKFNSKIIKNDYDFQNKLKKIIDNNTLNNGNEIIAYKKVCGINTICRFISYIKSYKNFD